MPMDANTADTIKLTGTVKGRRIRRTLRAALIVVCSAGVLAAGLTVGLYFGLRDKTTPLRLVILTDWHSNPYYQANLSKHCRCMTLDPHAGSCMLSTPASGYGQYGCDSPIALVRSSLEAAAAVVPEPDLVLVLGDLTMHSSPSAAITRSIFRATSEAIVDAFPSRPRACRTPLGNNDVYPNYATNVSDSTFYASQAAVASDLCGLDTQNAALFERTGYYSVDLPSPTGSSSVAQFLILNTNVYSANNAGTMHEPDPLGQFAWLEVQLAAARNRSARVHITSHIPPVIDSFARHALWQPQYAERYWAVIGAYADAVGLQLFGHTHSQEIRATRAGVADDTPVLQVASSVSPIYDNNPVFYTLEMAWEADGDGRWGWLMGMADGGVTRVNSFSAHVLNLSSVGTNLTGAPPFEVLEPPWPEPLVRNSDARKLLNGFFTAPDDDPTFWAFFNMYKGGHHGEGRACTEIGAAFHNCATCTHGCRVDFTCIQLDGLTVADHQRCLAEHSV